jgi:acetylornithine deacetylase/succinyl-diaminopimelate desuccinylase
MGVEIPPVAGPDHVESHISAAEVLDLARRLVAIPSFGPEHGWESDVARALEDLLRAEGLAVSRQPVADGRENLTAVLAGVQSGPPLLMLNGHMDTVPPSSAMRQPFAADVAGGRLWGRGAADMKGGLAAMVMAVIALRRAGVRPTRPVMLAAVAMEEMGNSGTFALARALADAGAPASFAVVGEPTGLDLVTAHKGVDRYQITVRGRAAHAATPERGLNAIVRASRLIAALDDALARVAQAQTHPLLGSASYNIGTISGGISRNTVPDRCTFQIEKRYLPGDSAAQICAEMQAVVEQTLGPDGAEVVHEDGFDRIAHPPLSIASEHPGVRALAVAAEEVTGRPPALIGWPAFTDAAILQAHGMPAVAAHADDESVPVAELWAAARIYIRLALRLCDDAAAGR